MEHLIVFGAKYLFAFVALGAAIPLVWLKAEDRTKYIVVSVLSGVVTFVFQKLAGMAYVDPRPFTQGVHALIEHNDENGFPSDHTALAFVAATLAILVERRLGVVLVFIASLVAVCRVLAGVHHPIDVVAGAVIGVGSVIFVHTTVATLSKRRAGSKRDSE
jgi:undecaprenyl-diphosphatase